MLLTLVELTRPIGFVLQKPPSLSLLQALAVLFGAFPIYPQRTDHLSDVLDLDLSCFGNVLYRRPLYFTTRLCVARRTECPSAHSCSIRWTVLNATKAGTHQAATGSM